MRVLTKVRSARRFLRWNDLLNHPKLRQGPLAWGIILLSICLFFIPFNLPGQTGESLGGYAALSLLPIVVAVLLRERQGALITFVLIACGTGFYNVVDYGLVWPSAVFPSWFIGNVSLLVLGLIAGQIRSMGNKLAAVHQQLTLAHEALQKQALTDPLTGLLNHRAIIQQMEKEGDRSRRFHRPFALLFFDGDRFKKVNDTYGHSVGDMVLCELGQRISSVLRGGDTIGRFGGEEFVVLLPETDAVQASLVAERIRASMAAHPVALSSVKGGINTTISVGIATYPADGERINELLEKADQAMYWAKRLGRNQVRTAPEAQRMSYTVVLDALAHDDERRDDAPGDKRNTERVHHAYYLSTIYSLMRMIEMRDRGISKHSHAVSDLATAIAQEMEMDHKAVLAVGAAALLHDIGKVAIPDALLYKAGPLSPSEQVMIQQHPELGAQILEISPFLQELMPAVRHHHERWDGKGYPDHLAGEHIPLAARIIGVAEAYDAMLQERPYQAGRSSEAAFAELLRCAGKQFDPTVVEAFAHVLPQQQAEADTSEVVEVAL